MSEGMAVHEVALEAGVAPSTVRLYARRGLLQTRRTAGNARRFGYDAPCRIAITKAAQRAGLDLAEIAELLRALPDDATENDWQQVSDTVIEAAQQRVADLQRVIEDVSGRAPLQAIPLSPRDVQARHRLRK